MQAHEERRVQIERDEYESRSPLQLDTGFQHQMFNDENIDEHETTFFSRQIQSISLASSEVTLKLLVVTEMGGHQDSQAHPVDHSPSSDTIPLPTASEDREVLGITTGDPSMQLDVSGESERPDQHHEILEIQESPSASQNDSEGSRIAQSKKGAAE